MVAAAVFIGLLGDVCVLLLHMQVTLGSFCVFRM